MKNDLDLIRAILLEVEARNTATAEVVEISGWPERLVARHVERLCQDGLLDYTNGYWAGDEGDDVKEYLVKDLSTRGHQFLGALRSGDVLQRLKSALKPSELAALSFGKLAQIAGELAEKIIRQKLGL
ncbi:DUF2513 domain-containing protein [Paracoccus laeviglucosivorans]|uniref:DUF2513 domain-containing protein n=1 Tax=Paracoccus laeviglucosivorans TaxID=1197861 RepID=A0A521E4J7_9RHOB|nr:DUF2513 domain-containing protein [Paracoccus laeviglucosivorans]SMO78884.1 Hypothetical protein SAMN06265221_11153 [Paracoccus laeviglucosivorans]